MKSKLKNVLVVSSILVVLIVVFFCYVRNKESAMSHSIFVSGVIEMTQIPLSFQVAGRIEKIFVDEGVFVKKGQILAQLNKDEFVALKSKAEAEYKEATLNFERLKEDFRRAVNLYKAGAITKQQRDAIETSYEMAKAKVAKLKAALDLAKLKLSYTNLYSPMDGFIIIKSAEEGQLIQPGAIIFTLLDLKHPWLTAYINETDLGRVKLNQEVNVKTDTYHGKIYKGRISFISQEAEFTPKYIQTKEERVKLVYRIKVDLNNQSLELKPGMPAEAYIQME